MVYKLVLGDWSKDGHKQSEDFLFDCNYDVHKIKQAYKDSCKKLGVAFHDEDYENCTKPLSDDYSNVWTDYETPYIDETDFEILNKAGCFKGIEYEKDRDRYYVNNLKDCAKLIMNFIALSMPEDFTYKLTESEIEPINGDWNGELNVQFGYGLFFD